MNKGLGKLNVIITCLSLLLALSGCGKLTLSLTDAAVDSAEKVILVFTGLEIQPENDDLITIDFPTSKSIDLMTLRDGISETLLTDEVLPKGNYSWIKLKLDTSNSFVTINGADYPLRIPDGDEIGLKISQPFSILLGGSINLTVDFDLRKSIYYPEGSSTDYVLRPSLRMVDEAVIGSISGMVDSSLISANTDCIDNTGAIKAVLYIFSKHDITADDIDGDAPLLITSSNVKADFSYKFTFLESGDYTISLTCEADQDDPATNDNIHFLLNRNVIVTAGQDRLLNFTL